MNLYETYKDIIEEYFNGAWSWKPKEEHRKETKENLAKIDKIAEKIKMKVDVVIPAVTKNIHIFIKHPILQDKYLIEYNLSDTNIKFCGLPKPYKLKYIDEEKIVISYFMSELPKKASVSRVVESIFNNINETKKWLIELNKHNIEKDFK
ncbi:MAG: hypothetical protein J6T10_12085 [Methanobrevibacter sp.]|nr:hypothetical protein [Methanobrevibacter sp.]